MRRVLLALATVALLTGCGDGDGEEGGTTASSQATTTSTAATTTSATDGSRSPAQRLAHPELALEGAFASSDPALACRRYVTSDYVRKAYGGYNGCASAVRAGGAADSIDIRSLGELTTQSYRPKIVPHGGPSDGEVLTVTLIFTDGEWRVGDVSSNVPVGP